MWDDSKAHGVFKKTLVHQQLEIPCATNKFLAIKSTSSIMDTTAGQCELLQTNMHKNKL
jgi:hypothetical protein